MPDIKNLKTSWTKYDSVQVIEIIGENDLDSYLSEKKTIDLPVLKSYLGVNNVNDPLPEYWIEIQKHSKQKRLFALVAGIFTHYKNIELFALKFSTENMRGIFNIGDADKHMTNLRSALVVSGAARNSFRKKSEVPYDLSTLYEEDEVGHLVKQLLVERLSRIGYTKKDVEDNFYNICTDLKFHSVLSLEKTQFKDWLEGKRIYIKEKFNYQLQSLIKYKKISAVKVDQWLSSWEDIDFSSELRRKPTPYFLIFKLDIRLLKRLSDIHRRRADRRRIEDLYVQRGLDEKRSIEIREFVKGGFPWSTISESERSSEQYKNLKMPGIMPTAIVANILGSGQKRGNSKINDSDIIKIENLDTDSPSLLIPDTIFNEEWEPNLKPIEIIDGQHRLLAFNESESLPGNYEVPVVAYIDLDRTWQAYLFYVINIKPKKINTSLGYDLYPLLRSQEWLENSKDGLTVYRETRAQELVEALWLYNQSPWYNNINMLGKGEGVNISQAAFIRALTSSYLKRSKRGKIGGLFSDYLPDKNFEEINWVRAQQAAFLILLWENIALDASTCQHEWALKLIQDTDQLILFDSSNKDGSNLEINGAFLSKNSMLSRDQGVTGISMFTNDLFFVAANYFNDYDFNSIDWKGDIDEKQIEIESVDIAISQFRENPINTLVKNVANQIVQIDWRTPTAIFEDETQRELQKKYKGSGGYREVWKDLLKIFIDSNNELLAKYALKIRDI